MSALTHGHTIGRTPTPEYRAWQSMHTRCSSPKSISYPNYGARGIVVCERWSLFANFLADMGLRPEGHQLDRIDNNGNYGPDNCRWASKAMQSRNHRRNVQITMEGKTMCLTDWAKEKGITRDVVLQRINALGWTYADALNTPTRIFTWRRNRS